MRETSEEQVKAEALQCRGCSERIWVFMRPGARANGPAMTYTGMAYIVLGDGTYVETPTFQPHQCTEDWPTGEDGKPIPTLEEWRDSLKGQYLLTKNEANDAQWMLALAVDCPKCHSKAEYQCINLTKAKRGIAEPTAWPHKERLLLVVAEDDIPQPSLEFGHASNPYPYWDR